jgi:uncharacterized protein with HEPN domain
MKLEPELLDNLRLILATITKAEGFVAGLDYPAFAHDDKTNFATVRAIKVISEAAQRVPRVVSERYPAIRWQGLAGLYDSLVAEDLSVDLEAVWKTVHERLPQVEPALAQALTELLAEQAGQQTGQDARG